MTRRRVAPAMTAWSRYERLEASGLWRPGAGAQRREVLVSFGAASLIIADRNEVALAHWSLPALIRLDPGQRPALYAPARDADETLEIADTTMVEAIETVRRALADDRPRRGRLRLLTGLGIALVLAALAWFWLPGALTAYTVGVVPDEQRARISRALMAEVTALTGPACTTPRGLTALGVLSRNLLGPGQRVVILPQGVPGGTVLPDGTVLIDKRLVEDYQGPEVLAATILRASLARDGDDPLAALLRGAGPGPTLRLLTTGTLRRATFRRGAETLLTAPRPAVPTDAFLALLATAGVPSTPYARAIDPTGESTLDLIEADPWQADPPPPLMKDSDWISLQQICEG